MSSSHNHHRSQCAHEKGFSLIEALVTVVVFGIGLLGVAWLQFFSMHFSTSAHQQSLATFLAADLVERMQANPVAAENGGYDNLTVSSEPADCVTAECTPAQIASRDVWEWQQEVQNGIPNATAVVCLDNKPDELSDTGTHDEERAADALDADCVLQNASCGTNGTDVYAVKIWWCDRELEGSEEDEAAIRYFVHTFLP